MRIRDCIFNCGKRDCTISTFSGCYQLRYLWNTGVKRCFYFFHLFLRYCIDHSAERWNVSCWSSGGFCNSESVRSSTFHQAWTLPELWHSEYFGTSWKANRTFTYMQTGGELTILCTCFKSTGSRREMLMFIVFIRGMERSWNTV